VTTAAGLDHRGHEGVAAVYHAHHIDADQPFPVLAAGVEEPADQSDACVVDHKVHSAEPGDCCVGESAHRVGVGHVDPRGQHLGASLSGHFGGIGDGRFIDVTERQTGTASRA
jgi:hypothetical protein